MTTWENVIENLKKLVGAELAIEDFEDEIIIAFEDYEFDGETEVIVTEHQTANEKKLQAYVRHVDAPIVTISVEPVYKDGEEGLMILGIEE